MTRHIGLTCLASLALAALTVAPVPACASSAAPGPGEAHAPIAGNPSASSPQQIVDRLVKEPLRFEGSSVFPVTLGQENGYRGEQPSRVLVGYHLEGARIEGEFVALDRDNRPIGATTLSGRLIEKGSERSITVPCRIDVALPHPLHLAGACGAKSLSGHYAQPMPSFPLMFILPGLNGRTETAGDYWLLPWRG
ncbi:hypothetical protein [Swaminathania salitolerans]|uniref:Uncharacterized protein n=1 Tax=Swaminathania salitolerans TaxID=182838 RepID=A0A511BSM7_9PROT|nr:hypothetical protein [Swaminathania salitolerans]GBQ12393.1 hypothetical protein AA21291_1174 [Swaminathania salitolerans LMG 21291]GEL02833.1 hypothetical protein SSA02_19960 [Swaminathania salitolerans]